MSNWNIAGGADSPNGADGLPTAADNDVGTIRAGGNITDTERFKADAVSLGVNRSITIVSGSPELSSPLAGGVFNGGDQVIVRVTDDIASVPNTVLLSGGSNSANQPFSIKQSTSIQTLFYKTAVRTGGWQIFSGVFDPSLVVSYSGGWDQTQVADEAADLKQFNTDNAANPSAAVPGEFVYRNGSPNPVQADYKPKTSY